MHESASTANTNLPYDVLLRIIMLIKKEKELSKRDYCDQARSNQMYLR